MVKIGTTTTLDMAHDSNKGGITAKSDVGNMLYNTSGKSYAVLDVLKDYSKK